MNERLDNLEFKLAFAERRIDELDDVVRTLNENMDVLIKEVKRLRQLQEPQELPPGNVKPPHY